MDNFSYLSGTHGSYIESLYETYRTTPNELDPQWQKFFEGFEFANQFGDKGSGTAQSQSPPLSAISSGAIDKEFAVASLIEAYRNRGHLLANTNPVRNRKDRKPRLDLVDFGLSESDLETVFSACSLIGLQGKPLSQVIEKLKKTYQGKIGFEANYVRDIEQRNWLTQKIENEWPEIGRAHV